MTTQSKSKKKPAIRSLALAIQAALAPSDTALGKVVAIANQKGGVGKTATSFNFAHYLNELGYRVLAVDLDGQGNFTELFFDREVLLNYVHTPALALFHEGTADNFQPLAHPSGIDVVATTRNCHELNGVDVLPISVAATFYENLQAIGASYDFIVIDTPPAPGVRTTSACASADYIYAPVLVDTFAESALEGVLGSIENISQLLQIELGITGILINKLKLDGEKDTVEKYRKLAAQCGDALIQTPIRQSKPFDKSQGLGIPVWHLNKSGSERQASKETREAYGEMASRITEIPAERIYYFKDISRAVRAQIVASSAGKGAV